MEVEISALEALVVQAAKCVDLAVVLVRQSYAWS